MTTKEKIKDFLIESKGWVSTRQLRQLFGEAADRRLRELKNEGLPVESMRGNRPDGTRGNTWFWRLQPGQIGMF